MQVLCKCSNDAAEIHCSVCGQGFALSWERPAKAERAAALGEVAKTLRSHHAKGAAGCNAHPQRGFLVGDRSGPADYSGARILGNAPRWAL